MKEKAINERLRMKPVKSIIIPRFLFVMDARITDTTIAPMPETAKIMPMPSAPTIKISSVNIGRSMVKGIPSMVQASVKTRMSMMVELLRI